MKSRLNSRYLRKNLTKSEKCLWANLRNRRFLNLKFRRQYPVGSYILDFYCCSTKLAIELDGSQHLDKDVQVYDQVRTKELETLGIKVLRFQNQEVNNNLQSVLDTIGRELEKRSQLIQPHPSRTAFDPPLVEKGVLQ